MIRNSAMCFIGLSGIACSMDLRSEKETGQIDAHIDSAVADTAFDSGFLEPSAEPSEDSSDPSSEPGVQLEPAEEPSDSLHPHDRDDDGDGFTENQGDCNDNDMSTYPGAAFAESDSTCRTDSDADGYGDATPMGLVDPGGDCDDNNAAIHPNAVEVPGDEIDGDCNNSELCFEDFDADSYGGSTIVNSWDLSCGGALEAAQDGDCDDTDPMTYPGSPHEVPYDGLDRNCDGLSDFDADGDGYDSIEWGGSDCDDLDALAIPIDDDGDGVPTCDGDCDDSNPSVHPNHIELILDSLDNDCDGIVDMVDVDDHVGSLFGVAGDYLSYPSGISVGDFTRDGVMDLALGSILGGGDEGVVHLLDGSTHSSWDSGIALYSYASIFPPISPAYQGVLPARQGDLNGDGFTDLVIAGTDLAGAESAVSIFYDTPSLNGMLSSDLADLQLTESTSYPGAIRLASDIDFDGDGQDELFFSDFRQGSYTPLNDYFFDLNQSSIFHVSDFMSGMLTLEDAISTELHRSGDREFLGAALSGADFDGDGDKELIFTAPGYDALAEDAGCLFVIHGSGLFGAVTDLAIDHSDFGFGNVLALCSEESGDYLGWGSPPVVADFNDDSLLDLAVAAPGRDRVYVFYDIANHVGILNPELQADVIIQAVLAPDWFGYSLVAGDFNRDGVADLAIGAPGASNPIQSAHPNDDFFELGGFLNVPQPITPGKVYLFNGPDISSVQSEADAASVIEGVAVDLFGMVMAAGDLNGDGFPELIVGAPRYAGNQGRITVYSGAP